MRTSTVVIACNISYFASSSYIGFRFGSDWIGLDRIDFDLCKFSGEVPSTEWLLRLTINFKRTKKQLHKTPDPGSGGNLSIDIVVGKNCVRMHVLFNIDIDNVMCIHIIMDDDAAAADDEIVPLSDLFMLTEPYFLYVILFDHKICSIKGRH